MSIFDRFLGAPNIQKLKQRGDVQGLLRALGYTAPKREDTRRIHRGALEALAEIGEAAVQPTFNEYLNPKRKSSDRALLVVLREIGKRSADQRLRLNVAEKLGELMDLRKENHAAILQALYSLASQPNLPTFPPAVQKVLRPRLHDPDSAIRAESALGMLITSVLMRDFTAIEHWFGEVQALCKSVPSGAPGSPGTAAAQRAAAALGEAAPVFSDDFFRAKAVALLFTMIEMWKENQPVASAVEAALTAYPMTAVPQLLARLEVNPKDAFAVETLETIGRRMLGGPQEAEFLERIVPFLEHRSWDTRQAAALTLRAIDWKPRSMTVQTSLLVAARSFSLSAWSAIQIDREVIEQLAATIDDPRYPARVDLVRHISMIYPQISDREARFRLRGVLARCLQSQPAQVQPYIVRGLAALDWQPGIDSAAVIYWTYLGEWERIVAIATYSASKPETTASPGSETSSKPPLGTGMLNTRALPTQPSEKTPSGSDTPGTRSLGARPGQPAPMEPAAESRTRGQAANASMVVDVLIECLSAPEIPARKTAARALAAIYQSSAIDGQTRSRILATSSRIDEYNLPGQAGAPTNG